MRAVLMNMLVFLVGVWIGSHGISEALLSSPEFHGWDALQKSSMASLPQSSGNTQNCVETDEVHKLASKSLQTRLWRPLWAQTHHEAIQRFNGYLVPSVANMDGKELTLHSLNSHKMVRIESRNLTEPPVSSAHQEHEPAFGQGQREQESLREFTVIIGGTLNIKDLRLVEQLHAIATDMGLEPELAISMAKVESNFNHKAVSPRGAIGVLQVMPQFACKDFEITPEMLFEPDVNIRVGLSYMKAYMERFDSDVELSLAAYNAGASRVVQAGFAIPPIRETQQYVRKVKQAMKHLREAARRS